MKISIIIPVYNCEKFIANCIDSVLQQTWRDYEIIIVTDGSTDSSGKICDEFARKDDRITVIHQENYGVSHARNIGLLHATGEAISFIDGDDTLESEMYEVLIQAMQEHNADISHCGYKHIVGEEIRLVHDTKRVLVQEQQEALECLVSGRFFGGGLWSKLFRRELLNGLTFRENLKNNEDILFNYEAFSKAKKVVFIDSALYNYIARLGTSAIFKTPDEKKIKDACEVSEYIYEESKGEKLEDIAAERYIRSLSGYYQYCMSNRKEKCKDISSIMKKVADDTGNLGRNMSITVKLICYCPWLYRIVIRLYKKIRKPQWEARKE